MVESTSHAQRRVQRGRAACLAAWGLRATRRRNVQAWRSVLRRPAHHRASATSAAPRSRRAVRPLAASAPLCLGQLGNASACAACGVSQRASTLQCKRNALTWRLATALRVRSACAASVLAPRPASAMRPMPAVASAALVAYERPLSAVGLPTLRCLRKQWRAMTANPSIERTYNGRQPCAVLRASRAPLYAAHVER
jgi:hypothetical protein